MADTGAGSRLPDNVTQLPVSNVGAGEHGGGRGGGSGGGDDSPELTLRDYVDAQDEKTRAQNETQFVRIESKLDNLKVPSIWQIAGLIVAAIGFVFAILAYAGDRFDGGLSASSMIHQMKGDQIERDQAQDQRLNRLIAIVEKAVDKPEGSPKEGQN